MKFLTLAALIVILTSAAHAKPPSIIGGAPMSSGTAHVVGVGVPSLWYEWWHSGNPDWALGVEMVYEHWVGYYSDVDIGVGLNVPLRWHIHQQGITDVGFGFKPGFLLADSEVFDELVLGARAEISVPVSIELHPKVSLITGGAIPFALFYQDIPVVDDVGFVIPILFRMGVEVAATPTIVPFFLLEVGPVVGIYDGNSDVHAGVRINIGTAFH